MLPAKVVGHNHPAGGERRHAVALQPGADSWTLAEGLGPNVVAFPGGHIGCAAHPTPSAEQSAGVLGLAGGNADGP